MSQSDSLACGNVWTVFYRAHERVGDVAVPSSRDDDPLEWETALRQAFRNAEEHVTEAARWDAITRELLAEMERREL